MSRGAYCNGEPIRSSAEALSDHQFISLCSRSSRVLRHALPCKVRMLGAATYNLLGVASGAMLGAIEKTPKIWDVAGVWAIVQAAGGIWINLGRDPQFPLEPGRDYGARSYPTLALASNDLRSHLEPLVRSAFGGETSPSP
jgi:myo-inositol-1(or 4)-monophosphatase